MHILKYVSGQRFRITRPTASTYGSDPFEIGDELVITGTGKVKFSNRQGYLVSRNGVPIERAYPPRFFERYCEKLEKENV